MNKDRVMDIHLRETIFQGESHVDDVNAHTAGRKGSGIRHFLFTLPSPAILQAINNEYCIWKKTDAALTIIELNVTLEGSATDITGDLKYADAFIGLANSVVINAFDTSAGILEETSIASGTVAAGKCLYLSFDGAPNAGIKQLHLDIVFAFD